MALLYVAAEAELTTRIRDRVAEGAAVWELSTEEIPAWFAAKLGDEAAVQNVFASEHAAVAILEDGRTIVGRAPRC
ncbi:MAG TPA: hypothetical protein VGK74_07440 [Symbiobacteriaceae bacterium]|jgi:hypothetical protein